MATLYLVTGFLGAGKTTLLKHMIGQMAGQRLAVIVNEFGREGIDGTLIKELGVIVREINNGSIFCSCRIDQFEEALARTLQDAPEVILVEASGLSDPTAIGRILEKYTDIDFAGGICLVDAVNFKKVIETARVSKKQLDASDIVLINKTDLVTPGEVDAVECMVRQYRPDAAIYRTSFGYIQPEWLKRRSPAQVDAAQAYHLKDVSLQKMTIGISGTMTFEQLEKFLRMFLDETYRVKGFVCLQGRTALVDCVGTRLAITPYSADDVSYNRITAMAGRGMKMQAAIKRAAAWYPQYVEVVTPG